MMSHPTRHIVITGPESTGKSVLTKALADHFGGIPVPEYAREYLERHPVPYQYRDLVHIAQQQQVVTAKALLEKPAYLFSDTWLIITKIWFEEVYGRYPDWLDHAIRTSGPDLFLVCAPDIPWEPDPLRENPNRREYLFERYIAEIKSFGYPFRIVTGKEEKRFESARNHLDNFFRGS
jgi:nicotinamide riboside kinase